MKKVLLIAGLIFVKDYKSLLQQLIQQNGTGEVLEYMLVSESGPDHDKIFEINVVLNNNKNAWKYL